MHMNSGHKNAQAHQLSESADKNFKKLIGKWISNDMRPADRWKNRVISFNIRKESNTSKNYNGSMREITYN